MGKVADPTKLDPHNSAYTRTLVVREHFLRHPGIPVWLMELRDVQQAAHCYEDDEKIRSAINNTRYNGVMNIQILVRGQCWMYLPNKNDLIQLAPDGTVTEHTNILQPDGSVARQHVRSHRTSVADMIEAVANEGTALIDKVMTPASERLYREKMITKSGDRILEDEDGVLFRAKELDL